MKVVVVINSLTTGGAERVVSTLTREWAKGHQILIALFDASRQEYDYGGELADLRRPSLQSPFGKLHNGLLRSVRLARIFRQQRPERIVSFMESANFPTIAAAVVTGLLGIVYVSVRNNPARISLPHRILIPIVYRLPERVVTPSEGVRRGLLRMGVQAGKLSVIPNPVAKRAVPGRYVLADCPPRYILGVGRLEPQKGFDRLLKAFSKIDRSDLQLVILGDGTERTSLQSTARELGIISHVRFPGVVSDIDEWYRRAECFVLTSHYEGSPNVIVEAMANGCPVVSFDCPYGPAEILEGGKSGILVAQDDIVGLSDAIRRLTSDHALCAHLSRLGRKRAAAYTVEKVAPRWMDGR